MLLVVIDDIRLNDLIYPLEADDNLIDRICYFLFLLICICLITIEAQ